MINIDLSHLSQIILDGIFDQELDQQIRIAILDTVPDKQYDIACEVFHKARQVYFDLGFIDNRANCIMKPNTPNKSIKIG